jgi:hypothetical protein
MILTIALALKLTLTLTLTLLIILDVEATDLNVLYVQNGFAVISKLSGISAASDKALG